MKEAITVDHLSVSYGKNEVLSDVCMHVEEGEFLGIIGPNGGGKSTLLRALLGTVPHSGTVSVFGEPVRRMLPAIGYVPQFAAFDRAFPIRVGEVVRTAYLGAGLHPFRCFGVKDTEKTETVLSEVGLAGFSERLVSDLSGGEFQRLLIARALAGEPKILLLDEPTASVDPATRAKIYELLSERNEAGMTVVLVTHDLLAISSSVKKLACLSRTLVYHGEPQIDEKVSTAMYGCPVDLIAHGAPHRVLRPHSHPGGYQHD